MGVLASTISRPQSATTYPVYDYAYDFTNGLQRFLVLDDAVNDTIASGQFTLLFAYQPDTVNSIDTAFTLWSASASNRSFWWRFRTTGVVQAYTSANGTSTAGHHEASHGMTANGTNWYFWACVVDMTEPAQDDKIKIYRNGTDVGATLSSGSHTSIYDVTFDNSTGTTRDQTCFGWGGRASGIGQSLDGMAHEFSILDTPLTSAQVSAIYNSGVPLSPRDNHNANVISRIDTSSLTYVSPSYVGDDEILGANKVLGLNTIDGNLSATGGIY
jgi:hypothetical protein